MKKMIESEGTQKGGKNSPYAGPMYSPGTKHQDSKNNVGAVEGPKYSKPCTDPLGYYGKGRKK